MPIDFSSLTSKLPKGLTDRIPTATLSKYWDNYKPQIIGGLSGAGIGAAGLGGAAALSGEEDPEVKSQNVKRNLLLGAALGGLGGTAAGAGYKMYKEPDSTSALGRLFRFGTNSNMAQGAAAGAIGNNVARRVVNQGLGWKGTGGTLAGKSIDQLKDVLDSHVKNFQPSGVAPAAATLGSAAAPMDAVEKNIRNTIERMTANKSTLGRLSQNSVVRGLGFNMIDPNAEHRIVEALHPLAGTPEGRTAIQRILGSQGGTSGRAMPLIEKALLGGSAGEEALRRSHALSALGRVGSGAALWTGLRGIFGD